MQEVAEFAQKIVVNVEKVMVGKTEEIKLVLVALLCEGHILVEDVPGVGKTMLAKAISRSLGCSFARVQFTPDLLPSDLIGINIYNQKKENFEFKPGPLHNQIILADEINRATPKTQSALLEAMEERQITVDGVTLPLGKPFLVMATQNPIEYEGTFPLPESQLDRFMLRVRLGYPDEASEKEILARQQLQHPIDTITQVMEVEELLAMQAKVKEVFVEDSLRKYLVAIVRHTREEKGFYLGASPRGSLALLKASQALAAIEARDFVLPDDIKKLVLPTLAHRVIPRVSQNYEEVRKILEAMLAQIPVPV